MKILLTGAAGFIGSHLAERLLTEGHAVTGLDNFDPYYDPALKRRNVARALHEFGSGDPPARPAAPAAAPGPSFLLPSSEGSTAGFTSASSARPGAILRPVYRLVEGDLGDASLLDRLLSEEKFDAVVHLAAQAGVRPSLADPLRYERVNVAGLLVLLEALRRHGPPRLVAASSSSVYGDVTPAPFREDAPCAQPQSPYGASKRAGEIYLGTYARLYGFRTVVVRPFTVYGPRQRPDMAITSFARLILRGETLTLYGDGSSARDYTYVEDIVDGLLGALACPVAFGVYNLGGEHPVSLADLLARLERILGRKALVRREPLQPGDVTRTCADLTRARKDLGFSPKVPLDEGLRRTVAWVKEELAREGRGT